MIGLEPMLWLDPECEPTHECPICGRECFGNYDLCTECRENEEGEE